MIRSMTGYAAAAADSPRGTLSLELRSVNARFLDLQFRVAEELRSLEPRLRDLILARVARRSSDLRVFLNDKDVPQRPQRLNAEAITRLRSLAAEAQKTFPDAAPLRVADVLRWPGVVAEPEADEEALRVIAERLCQAALDQLVAAREREGAKLAASIGERIAAMRRRLAEVAPLVPQSLAAYQAKLAERLREALGSADDDRVRAELAVFASKADVDEELTRLNAHFGEVERTLAEGGARSSPVGKRLDFIAQELNREANTLAAKAASQEISDCALELKLLIEQMREQVQNIE